ncbi:hypothetical protein PG997_007348 [Apiospora hydei]|uniref:Uncharacterized protein n=1 Tax=Apiospora hydei TaxID=1337664 RepID=A0ABR1W7R1_9PEZI
MEDVLPAVLLMAEGIGSLEEVEEVYKFLVEAVLVVVTTELLLVKDVLTSGLLLEEAVGRLGVVEDVDVSLKLVKVSSDAEALKMLLVGEVESELWLVVDIADETKLLDELSTIETLELVSDAVAVEELTSESEIDVEVDEESELDSLDEVVSVTEDVDADDAEVDKETEPVASNEDEIEVNDSDSPDVNLDVSDAEVVEVEIISIDELEAVDAAEEIPELSVSVLEPELVSEIWDAETDEVVVVKVDVSSVDRVEVETTSADELDDVAADETPELSIPVSATLDVRLPELVDSDSDDSVEVIVLPELTSELLELCVGGTLDRSLDRDALEYNELVEPLL